MFLDSVSTFKTLFLSKQRTTYWHHEMTAHTQSITAFGISTGKRAVKHFPPGMDNIRHR